MFNRLLVCLFFSLTLSIPLNSSFAIENIAMESSEIPLKQETAKVGTKNLAKILIITPLQFVSFSWVQSALVATNPILVGVNLTGACASFYSTFLLWSVLDW